MSTQLDVFKSQFNYRPEFSGYVGVERESFLVRDEATFWQKLIGKKNERVAPEAARVLSFHEKRGIPTMEHTLSTWGKDSSTEYVTYSPPVPGEFSQELSACQIESRIGPSELHALQEALKLSEDRLEKLTSFLSLQLSHREVGPADMPLDVYPDPSGRYQAITKDMPRETLLAACRVIGTHVHVGMPDHDTALRVYNHVSEHFHALCELGNGSFGERLAIYRTMAPKYQPMPYESWQHFHDVACQEGFETDPRKCWTLIRISVHGTIEFRMFGATDSIDRIVSWATRCHALCMEAMTAQ